MEIQYLKEMKKHPTILGFTNRGLPMTEIESLEQKYNTGKPFPKAFREFLFLAGDFDNTGIQFDDFDYLQEGSRDTLKHANKEIKRPFFAFDHINDCEHFGFFYLDDKDDDPKVYVCHPYDKNRDLVTHHGFTFSSLINEAIRRRLNNLSF